MANGVFTHSVGVSYKSDEGTVTSVTQSFTGNSEAGLEEVIAVGATNLLFSLAVTKSQIVVMLIAAVGGSLTVKTNSSSTPQDTIALAAGAQQVWYPASTATCPFSGNVTAFYVTNTDTKASTFKFRACLSV